jgi:FkbM family methyltransferase
MKQAVRALLSRMGYRIEGIRYTPRQLLEPERMRTLCFDDVICHHMFEHGEECVFIQVGAYDGVSTDPLRKYIERCGWRGVMLEPQPRPAARLRELYKDNPGIVVMETALDGRRRTRTLYTVEADDISAWAGGMASFDRDHILKHDYLVPGIATRMRELQVECIVIEDVLEKLPGERLDLLQIDAEGADGYILSLFPFERIKPAIVQWEVKNMKRKEQEAALELLGRHRYLVARANSEDMLAVRRPVS